jgi:hypothetical protein
VRGPEAVTHAADGLFNRLEYRTERSPVEGGVRVKRGQEGPLVACFDGLIRSGVSADDIALSEAYRNGNPMERCPWCKLSGF